MADISLTTMTILSVIGCSLLGAVAVRMILAPDTAQARARSSRLQAMIPKKTKTEAAALVRSGARTDKGLSLPFIGNVGQLLRRADLDDRRFALCMGILGGGAVFGALLTFFTSPVLAFPAGIGLTAFIVLQLVNRRYSKRMDALTLQLPDALDLMMRGLRVGHPINATIANVGRTMADPVGAEFRTLAHQVSHGDYLTDAFRDFADRTGHEDIEYLSVSIAIQHGTGGNLANMIDTLSKVVRARIMMRRRVKAISSEGRISAYVLSGLPVLIYLATSITAPAYYADVSDDPMFKPMAVAIVALIVANFLALRKLVSFEV
ncbi:type II secretion system F family protein [Sulfitobacter sp. S223]|uniref:type II secretion system F family protein n=1 Tax=Sulfitobacter sp. S223 TaxID=2867023 RepID=UPI0021A622B2|nr:type II secretion system F family protein [Sulfitobacter sp. S223]UWR25889.1 type II secretion system F family protein [Sulfitobacter sp. S223]